MMYPYLQSTSISKKVFDDSELEPGATIKKYLIVQTEGVRQVSREAEVIYKRANADKPHMGLTTWKDSPDGKIIKSDVSIAKNYLSEDEMGSLERIVSAYLDLAEDRARRHIPMTMEDWAKRLDIFLQADERAILTDVGSITAEIAKFHAVTEFEKYRIIQDRLFESDYDRYIRELEEQAKKAGDEK
jgi:hypothetical protein